MLESLFSKIKNYKKKNYFKVVFSIIIIALISFTYSAVKSQKNAHADTPSFTFATAGDLGASSNTSATLDHIASSSNNFVLALGDLDYGELLPESAWCSYVQNHLGSNMPFEIVSGNHEDGGEITGGGLIDNFIQCLPDKMGSTGTYGKEYYFDYPSGAPIARFIMISPALTFTNGGYYNYSAGSTHYNWVASTIDSARAAGIKWIIVGMHKNCISMGVQTCEIGSDIFNLLVNKKVDLILQGHDHDYQRSKQLALNNTNCLTIQAEVYNSNCVVNDGSSGTYTKGAGTVLVIVGTAGEGLATINTSDGDAGYFYKWMGNNINPTNGFSKFTVSSDQLSISTNFIGSTTPNNFTDSFSINTSTLTPTPTPTPSPIPPPGGSISLRTTSTGNNGTGSTSLTINEPAGTTTGDVMIAHVAVKTAGNTITPPSGWTLIKRQDSGWYFSTATYWKLAGSSEPSSYTWTFGSGKAALGGIAGYIGVDNTNPIDASNAQYNYGTSIVSNAGITTTTLNDMLFYSVGIVVATTVNDPAGFSEEWITNSSAMTSEMSEETFPAIGATGTITGSHNGGNYSNITHLIALKPAGISGSPTPTPTPISTVIPTPTPTTITIPTSTPSPTQNPTPTPTPLPVISGNGLSTPKGITLAGTVIWVSNYANSTISRFNPDGSSAGTVISGNGLSGPYDEAVVGNQVWVVNAANSTISRFNPDGSSAGTVISGNGLSAPKGIVVVNSQVWVSNHGNNTISLFNFDGTSAGTPLSGNGLNGPRGGTLVGSQVWIPNSSNSTISLFNVNGTSTGNVLSSNGLNVPEDSALINNNQIWLPNYSGNSISLFNTDGTSAGSPLSGNGLSNPHGVVQVGSNIWIINAGNNTISRF